MPEIKKDLQKYEKFITSVEKATSKMNDWADWKKSIHLLDSFNIKEEMVVKKTYTNTEDSEK